MVKNPYYLNCIYLDHKYVDHGINGYFYSYCGLFNMNLNQKGIKSMCCINNSPYIKLNCKYFKSKEKYIQSNLNQFL